MHLHRDHIRHVRRCIVSFYADGIRKTERDRPLRAISVGRAPVYDCGAIDCYQCEREFGPDRAAAIRDSQRRQEEYRRSTAP